MQRFLSVDPLTRDYPYYTPYQFAGNSPILNIDLDGKEPIGSIADMNAATRDSYYTLLGPKKGEEEYKLYRKGQLYGMIGALAITTDVFLTKGRISKYLFYSQIANIAEHNRATTPEGKLAQDERSKAAATDAFMELGISKTISVFTRIAFGAGKVIYKTFSSTSIRFSQSSVNGLDEIVTSMKKNDWKGNPIDIVKMEDGIYTTVDNTRLLAAQKAGINVQANAHSFDDAISEEIANRFLGKDGSVPKTWGEAVKNRIQNQNKQFRTTYENGSFVEPKSGTGN